MKPVALSQLSKSISAHEWQPVRVTGTFHIDEQILLRNRYSDEGIYGFELLTLFTSTEGQRFWIDCGWVKAGESALTRPSTPQLPTGEVSILGRVRLESSLPTGTFFALPTQSSDQLVAKANAQRHITTEDFYLDLIELPYGASSNGDTPFTPAELPELSDGPHMAYALQWLFFAGLTVYGRLLIRRDVLSSKEL